MQFSVIIVGTLAAFATAHVVRSPEPAALKGVQFPGIDTLQEIIQCIVRDSTWKADYSDKKSGKVTFSSVSSECCGKAKAGWETYGENWNEFAQAKFNNPCDGGQLSGMKEKFIDTLRHILGDGHKST